jgi:hypothetical protein
MASCLITKQQTGNPGQDIISDFCADLPDSMNAKLAGISGKSTNEGLGELTFHWDYVK